MTEPWIVGLFTLGGALVGSLFPYWNARLERKDRRQQLVRKKFEDFCELIIESGREIDLFVSMPIPEAMDFELQRSATKAMYLSMIYFPDLQRLTSAYNDQLLRFRIQVMDVAKDTSGPIESLTFQAIAVSDPMYTSELQKVFLASDEIRDAIGQYGPSYVGVQSSTNWLARLFWWWPWLQR